MGRPWRRCAERPHFDPDLLSMVHHSIVGRTDPAMADLSHEGASVVHDKYELVHRHRKLESKGPTCPITMILGHNAGSMKTGMAHIRHGR